MKKCKFRNTGLRSGEFIGIVFLTLLLKEPSYGYKLIEKAKKFDIDSGLLERGVTYRMLHKLEVEELVKSYWSTPEEFGPPKRVYKITDNGKTFLKNWIEEIKDMQKTLDLLIKSIKKDI